MGEAKRKELMNGTAVHNGTAKPDIQPPKPPSVGVLVPSMGTFVSHMGVSLAAVMTHTAVNGVGIGIINENGSMITRSRNELTERGMAVGSKGFDYFFWSDADVTYPADSILRLLKHKKDIVGAIYNMRSPPHSTLGHFIGPKRDLSGGGLAEMDYMPGGLMLVKAEVYRSLTWPWYFECYRRAGTPMQAFIGMMRDSFALALPTELEAKFEADPELGTWLKECAKVEFNGGARGYLSEDYAFSRKAIRAGYRMWCDLDLSFQCTHVGETRITLDRPMPPSTTRLDPSSNGPMAAMIDLNRAPARPEGA